MKKNLNILIKISTQATQQIEFIREFARTEKKIFKLILQD